MASSSGTDCPDLVQVIKAGDKVQQLVQDLPRYFRIEDIIVAKPCLKMQCMQDELQVLDKVREEFKNELKEPSQLKKVLINPSNKDIN